MNKEQILAALDLYENNFIESGFQPKRFEEHHRETTRVDQYNHAWWMIQEMRKMLKQPDPNMEKIFRWLGFLQGVLWCINEYSIDEMREHNR